MKLNQWIKDHDNLILWILIAIMTLTTAPHMMKRLAQATTNSEARYGNCHILTNYSGDLYLCKKNE